MIHQGRVLRLVTASFEGPGGERFERDIVRSLGAVAVVAVDLTADGGPEAVVVSQYRPALAEWLTEIPAGMRDVEGEPPELTAARELAEETGFAAEHYELLTVFVNAAGMTDQRTHIYLATGLRSVPSQAHGVEETYMKVSWLALRDVPELIASGELADAKTVVGLLLALRRLAV